MRESARILLVFFIIPTISGCLSPTVLNRAVEVYDDAAIRAESKQLLINIVRARHHELRIPRKLDTQSTANWTVG
ncbi:MAG TPA: hypothetical protein PKG49_06320, partial [Nitrosomonas mobilis]|nr:hypothetical protein [Nitrosomonas mobilis]